jgi:hypothetical protein
VLLKTLECVKNQLMVNSEAQWASGPSSPKVNNTFVLKLPAAIAIAVLYRPKGSLA